MSGLTPETDKNIEDIGMGCQMVSVDFARKLENERNEAREAFVIATDQMVVAQCKLRESNKERDDAREERDKLQAMRNEVVAANKGAKINAKVSNSLAAKLTQAWKERDEAQAARDILRFDAQREAEHHDRMVGELEKVYAERDEARKESEYYKARYEQLKDEQTLRTPNIPDHA